MRHLPAVGAPVPDIRIGFWRNPGWRAYRTGHPTRATAELPLRTQHDDGCEWPERCCRSPASCGQRRGVVLVDSGRARSRGNEARGFLNLKRLLGKPDQFRLVIEELAKSVPAGVAVAACDKGAWPLVGALVLQLGTPGVLVLPDPKEYFVSYGDDPALGNPRLAGERLDPGTRVHLIDDLIYSGETLRSAFSVLTSEGLTVREASVIVGANSAERLATMVTPAVLERITCLFLARDLDLPM